MGVLHRLAMSDEVSRHASPAWDRLDHIYTYLLGPVCVCIRLHANESITRDQELD